MNSGAKSCGTMSWCVGGEVLLQVRLAILFAGGPGVDVADGVGPGPEVDAAMRQVVVLLDRAVELAERRGERPGRIAREVVFKEDGAFSAASTVKPNTKLHANEISRTEWRTVALRMFCGLLSASIVDD